MPSILRLGAIQISYASPCPAVSTKSLHSKVCAGQDRTPTDTRRQTHAPQMHPRIGRRGPGGGRFAYEPGARLDLMSPANAANEWELVVPDDDAALVAEFRRHGIKPGQRVHVALVEGAEASRTQQPPCRRSSRASTGRRTWPRAPARFSVAESPAVDDPGGYRPAGGRRQPQGR